jgi:hypothetical protein
MKAWTLDSIPKQIYTLSKKNFDKWLSTKTKSHLMRMEDEIMNLEYINHPYVDLFLSYKQPAMKKLINQQEPKP